MKTVQRDDTVHLTDYVTLHDAQTEIEARQDRIRELEEQLDALHDRNLSLEFRLKQAESENADHEKDYFAVWKALRPRHGAGFQRDHENIAEAVQRLVKEHAEMQAANHRLHAELLERSLV